MDDADRNKLFVGGISWETTEDVLNEHFYKYGVVSGSVIAKDRVSGQPRGFAFVTFSDSSAVDRALQDSHQILSRTVEVKRAIPRSEQQSQLQYGKGLSRNFGGTNNGWFLSAYFLGGYGEEGRGKNGLWKAVLAAAKSWSLGIPLGLIIRAVTIGHAPPTNFILVTMGSTAVLLVGWRTLLFSIFPTDKAKKNDVYKRGSPFELFEVCAYCISRSNLQFYFR
ncbi:Unknown protein [Striga hermonthica]|uniref:RRM domain-containing protein n=1 Tax=Striga hermonthica TaxID=68872 RepID=A0A9N7RJI7_STRHE|nr:Unknown protein [Striga hermonthica]